MNRLFGSSKKTDPKPTLNDCINTLDSRASSIEGKIKKLDAELIKLKEQLARMPEGPSKANVKQQALRLLQQKKQYEAQLGQMQQQSFTLEQTSFATEQLKDTQIMVSAMKSSVQEMKSFNRKMNIDKVENMRDELDDLMQDSREISEVMSRSYDMPDYLDEADLEAELGALQDLELDVQDSSYLDEIPAMTSNKAEPAAMEDSKQMMTNNPYMN